MRKILLRQSRIFPISNPPPHGHKYPRAFLDIEVDQKPLGRVVFELYDDIAPRTVENFLRIADGVTVGGRKLHYKNTTIDKILPFRGLWGGFLGGSIYGRYFPDESFKLVHDKAGILTTANPKINTNDSQFIITLGPAEYLNFKSVGFGQVLQGFEYIAQLEKLGGIAGVPLKKIIISNSGVVSDAEYHSYDKEEEFNVLETSHH